MTKDNLGTYPSLVAGAALLTDYVLTVAVSVAAGVAAVTSAVPALFRYRIALGVLAVVLIAVANLRGLRESGHLFAIPAYLFMASIVGMIAYGTLGAAFHFMPETPYTAPPPGLEGIGLFLFLRAFGQGCTALTGVEAVSDGVPAFTAPEAQNARTVLGWLGVILVTMFLGITLLASLHGVLPRDEETVVSQLAWRIFGGGLPYFCIQGLSMLILVLAANTAFADFPGLAFFMARDGYLPRQFSNRGDRLVFSNGVVILAVTAAVLVTIFSGSTHALIPLYAVGVFTSFTLSQTSMVRRWLRMRPEGWWWRVAINGVGAATTAVVLSVVASTTFVDGAWIVVLLIAILIVALFVIKRHYDDVARQLSLDGDPGPPPITHSVLVLVGDLHRGVVEALQYARTLSPGAKAVYVEADPERTRRLEERWVSHGLGVPLIVLTKSLIGPLMDDIDHLQTQGGKHMATIVVPEFLPVRWWQHLLHNQAALLIKGALLFRKNVIVTDVPYHLTH